MFTIHILTYSKQGKNVTTYCSIMQFRDTRDLALALVAQALLCGIGEVQSFLQGGNQYILDQLAI